MTSKRTIRACFPSAILTLLATAAVPGTARAQGAPLPTPSESTGWQVLSAHDDVTSFYRELQMRSPWVRTFHLGETREGRELLTVTLARPAVTSPMEAHATGKPIVFIGAQVHGNEPGGKEGLMLFARELAIGGLQDLLDDVVFVFVPQINPDAAEAGEFGTRTNPSGYNLNRDYARLDNPEIRAFVNRGLVRWEPHVVVDAHEAQGPPRFYDFYTSYPRNHGSPVLQSLLETEVLPALVGALEAAGFNHFFYHIVPQALVAAAEQVSGVEDDGAPTAPGTPAALREAIPPITLGGGGARSLSSYGGPHGAITLLYESLRQRDPRIGIERRARMHYAAMEGLGRYVARNRAKVTETVARAREEMISKGSRWDAADSIYVEWEPYVTRTEPYNVVVGDEVVELAVPIRDGRRPVFGRIRPEGYLIEAHRGDIAEHLALHGVAVERLLEPTTVEVESYRVEAVTRSDPNEGFIPRAFTVSLQEQTIEVPAGTWVARAGQKRAGILFHLMEPEDSDSYAAGGWFINHEGIGDLFPVHRIRTLPRAPMQLRTADDFR